MGSITSLHIFLEEHFHPALHKAPGNTCSYLSNGWGFMMGSATVALGSALYYTSGISAREGAYDRSWNWPPYVADRIKSTYLYYATSLVLAAISMASVNQFPDAMAFLSKYTLSTILWGFLALLLTGDIMRAIPYTTGHFGGKQIAFIVYSATMGIVLAPVCLLGGPVTVQASWMTAVVVAVITILAVFAPTYWLLGVSLPLSFCYILVFLSILAGFFWPTSTNIGSYTYAINLYVGLVAHAGFLMFYSHFFFLVAERIPNNDTTMYDPISASMLVSRFTMDLFIRIAVLLVGGGNGVFKKVCKFEIPK